jgi:serine/threonine protein phosphatase PrpC
VAGVCDRGLRHARNEDAIAVAVRPEPVATAVLVVCDGVSSADRSDLASRAAAEAACDALVADAPAATDPVSTKILFWTGQLRAATHAAQAAAVATAGTPPSGNPPSCTLAAAVADGDLIVAAWVGDSRIYWLPDSGPATQLSVDHSWTTEQVALGVPRHVAESGSMAHAITRWLGADAPDPNPVCATVVVDGPGWLLVCSDGLWNYCPGPGEVDVVVSAASASCGGRPVDVARTLVAWANDKGGHDNVSVALARLPAPTGQVAPTAVMSSLRSAG